MMRLFRRRPAIWCVQEWHATGLHRLRSREKPVIWRARAILEASQLFLEVVA